VTVALDRGTAPRRWLIVGGALLGVAAVAVAGLLWAKWLPYGEKLAGLAGTHAWSGSSILTVGGVAPGDAPSWHAATSFFDTYLQSIWKALVAALLISAAVSALVPAGWAARLLTRRSRWRSAAVGGALGTPSMMCTCCTAPVVATLRREGAGMTGVVAYWLGNPLLNPAVLAFLAFVAPWQWTVTRLVVGLLVVVGGSAVVGYVAERGDGAAAAPSVPTATPADGRWLAGAPVRFVRTLGRLLLFLVPEYLAVVLLIGALRGWLFPLGAGGSWTAGVGIVLLAAIVGTLVVIPTAGEIPIVAGLAAVGLSLGGAGALLLTLPAASLPAMAMLARPLGWRATAATAGVVAVGGLIGAGVLTALG
jgi:uncharacterized membrane protein YraQ (UPF0718 family)